MWEEIEDLSKNKFSLSKLLSRKAKYLRDGQSKLLISSTNSFREGQEQDWDGVDHTSFEHMLG